MAVLILNPANDEQFATYAHDLARDATDPDNLQARLRERYPLAIARSRDLSGDDGSVWYVYRDGHWVTSRE